MLYLVYVLTFLAGILFYALSPHDNQLDLNARKAEGFIASFLAQHQAAKDYMTQWLGFNLDSQANSSFGLDKSPAKFYSFFPKAITNAGTDFADNQGTHITMQETLNADGTYGYLTTVFCMEPDSNGDGVDDLVACNNANRNQAYLTTYNAGRPDWWPAVESNRQRRYGSWRNALTRRISGSYNCGVLVCGQQWNPDTKECKENNDVTAGPGYWCIDNGQTVKLANGQCGQKVPLAISNALGCNNPVGLVNYCEDSFFCISKVKQGPDKYYVPGITAFYDGINNKNTGAEGDRYNDTSLWEDLKRPGKQAGGDLTSTPSVGANFSDLNQMAATTGITFPYIHIVKDSLHVFRDFTLTVLLKGNGVNSMNVVFLKLGNVEFKLTQTKKSGKNDAAKLHITNSSGSISTDLPDNLDPINKIISLTVVGKAGQAMRVHVNSGTTPIIELRDRAAAAVAGKSSELPTADVLSMQNTQNLQISSLGEPVYVYGVRYYDNKALSVRRQQIHGGYTPSELERNFNLDAKRYGIESTSAEGYRPTFN